MSDPFVGEIKMFTGGYVPQNFASCDGLTMAIQQNQALFAVLANTYGGSLEARTFMLPDLQGRMPIGPGVAPQGGTTDISLGGSGGAEQVTLDVGNLPAHTHQVMAFDGPATASSIQDPPPPGVRNPYYLPAQATDQSQWSIKIYGEGPAVQQSAIGVTSAGGSQAFSVRNPYLTVGFIICTSGIPMLRPPS